MNIESLEMYKSEDKIMKIRIGSISYHQVNAVLKNQMTNTNSLTIGAGILSLRQQQINFIKEPLDEDGRLFSYCCSIIIGFSFFVFLFSTDMLC